MARTKKVEAETPEEQTEQEVAAAVATSKAEQEAKKMLLKGCEETIATSLKYGFEIGQALRTIHDQELYKEDYSNFNQYCEERWNFSGSHARRRMNQAEFHLDAAKYVSPEGEKFQILPENEAQVRPIIDKVEKDKWMSTWEKVVKKAQKKGWKITGEFVQKCLSSSKRNQKAKVVKTPSSEDEGDASGPEADDSKVASECVTLVKQAKDKLKADDTKSVRNLLNKILRLLEEQLSVS